MATEASHEAAPRAAEGPPRGLPVAGRAVGRGVPPKLWIGGGLLVVAIAYLMMTSLQTNAVYYVTVSELVARGGSSGQTVRVGGAVVDGSIQHDRTHLSFQLTDGTAAIPVQHTGTVPDLFGYRTEGAYQDVVVEGRLGPNGVFEARNIIVKHGPAMEAADADGTR